MPNSTPAADNQTVIEFRLPKSRARELDLINIYPSGAITKAREGNRLAEINEMKNSGAIAVTDDGSDVQDENVLRLALQYAKTCGILLMSHCEMNALTGDGVMHEGAGCRRSSVCRARPRHPRTSPCKRTSCSARCAKRGCISFIYRRPGQRKQIKNSQKRKGYKNLSAEVCVQHFALTDAECRGYNTNAKIVSAVAALPDHIEAIIEAIKDDTIDAFTTDHAPHIEPEKLEPFQHAAFGSTGLETSFAVMNTYLVKAGHIKLSKGISKMTCEPARIIRINKGTLSKGADADIAIFDTKKEWTVDARKGFSKGRNCIFDGKKLTGKAVCTIVGGKIKYRDGKFPGR